MRTPLIAANWKMYKSREEARALALAVREGLGAFGGADVVLCPPFVYLAELVDLLAGSPVGLGAQNVHWDTEGAYTGEVSVRMLTSLGCRYVIVGHSERRHVFGETDEVIRKKLRQAVRAGLTTIFCVGEKIEEREAGRTMDVVERQLRMGLDGLEDISSCVVAYEPVWAIGTGHTATPEQAEEVHRFIRTLLGGFGVADRLRIIYGGSVKPGNIRDLLDQPDIDGALVGGASLEAESFLTIVRGGREA